MANPFDAIRKLLGSTTQLSAADADAGLARVAALEAELRAVVTKLTPQAADILAPADARAKARQAVAEAEMQLTDVATARNRLETARAAALAADENDRRQRIYDATATRLGRPGARAEAYGQAARATLAAVRDMATMSLEVAEANAALPANAVPLSDPFEAFALAASGFLSAGLPREVVKERQVSLWCFSGTDRPVGGQERIVDGGDGRGYSPPSSGRAAGNIQVEKRTFLEVTVLPVTANAWADHRCSASNLALPGFFTPPTGAYAPCDAAGFIAAIDAITAFEASQPPKRQPVIELYPVTTDGEIRDRAA